MCQRLYLICLLIVCVIWPVLGFSSDIQRRDTIIFNVEDAVVANDLRKQLIAKKIWYKDIDDSTLVIDLTSASKVIEVANTISNRLIPKGRNASFHREMFLEVVNQLDQRNIPYRVIVFAKEKWIVWDEKDAEAVKSVIDEVSSMQ